MSFDDEIIDSNSSVHADSIINNNYAHGGRLGNGFFVGMAMHFISKKNNLAMGYRFYDEIKRLGVDLFIGKHTYKNTIELLDTNFFDIITSTEPLRKNISIVNNMWCQTREFSKMIRDHFSIDTERNNIINNNIFKERYNNNEDLFVHIRLGDIVDRNFTHPITYYNKVLQQINAKNRYISSDSIDHPLCKELIEKYNLTIINYDEVETIMFASTCKNIVLSSGTFSWLIGVFGFYSNVTYPKIYNGWHGDIFVFDDWNEIEYKE
jgi:hypothetical protein